MNDFFPFVIVWLLLMFIIMSEPSSEVISACVEQPNMQYVDGNCIPIEGKEE